MVALASILSMDSAIVILDEPTTGQDPASVARIARVVAGLREQGKTVVTISHDIDFAAENFSRVIALSEGQVLLDGPAESVLGEEAILAQTYVDPPQLTRLGKRLGMARSVLNPADFLTELRKLKG
jgi:energy-coupling factor transport system ATP-binding protein